MMKCPNCDGPCIPECPFNPNNPQVGESMSWKPEFLIEGQWYDNAQRFATKHEARASAVARFQVWTMPSDCRAIRSDDDVNYKRTEEGDKSCTTK